MSGKTSSAKHQEALKALRGASEAERLLHRLHSVVMVLNGYSASEAARIYGDSPRAVSYWVTRFNKMGAKGLHAERRPGRPASLNAKQQTILKTFIKQQKAKSTPVNAETVSQFIKSSFGIDLTNRHCRRILKCLNA